GIDYPITMTITTDSDNSTTPYVVLVFYGHKKETVTDTTNGQNKLVRTISTLYWWTLESARTN
ncbi:MAG: hypothetical protein HUJ75_04110, partial [Parasporobacterium sp.]|nr:hypothetical protein [Parasporobacterium sp.]